jgi:hypothetical protein
MRWLSMQVLRENAPMLRIARKLGMTIVDGGADLFARLELIGRLNDVALRDKCRTVALRSRSHAAR